MITQVQNLIKTTLQQNQIKDNPLSVYAFTNENINSYLASTPYDIRTVLSICSSGDHLYNLASLNPSIVTLVDQNPLTEYYALGLKKALIKAYSYSEFLDVIYYLFKSRIYDLTKEANLFKNIFKYIPQEYTFFFKEIITYYFNLQSIYKRNIRLLEILTKDYYYHLDALKYYNKYLQSSKDYELLQKFLNNVLVTFHNRNIFNEPKSNYYDLVLSSNVLDYTIKKDFTISSLYNLYHGLLSSLKKDGLIYAHYIYDFYDPQTLSYKTYPIISSDIQERELLKENLIWVDNYKGNKDVVLVLKKY